MSNIEVVMDENVIELVVISGAQQSDITAAVAVETAARQAADTAHALLATGVHGVGASTVDSVSARDTAIAAIYTTAHTWTLGQTFQSATEQDGTLTLKALGGYKGAIELDTTGSYRAAPWRISVLSVDPAKHDNVFLLNYNLRNNSGGWERIVDNEHCVLWNIESRFSPVDHVANRGQLEWYIRLATALTGAVTFDRQPFNLLYNFDDHTTAFSVGDTGRSDTGNTFHFYDGGVSGGVVLHNTSLTIRGSTETDRLNLVMNSSTDTAQMTAYDELAALYLNFELRAGGYININADKAAGYMRFDVQSNRITVINATGLGVFTTFPARALDVYGQSITRNSTTTTNAVLEAARLEARVSTAATGGAAGFGPTLDFAAETATDATYQQQARIKSLWVDPVNATRTSDLVLSAYDTSEREGIRIRGAGTAAALSFFGGAPAAKPTGVAVTAEGIHAALVTLGLIAA